MVDSILDLHPEKVSPEPMSGCWIWTAGLFRDGYGKVWFRDKTWKAHRISYTISCEEISENLLVLHKCDVRSCVNPEHLFVGTHKDNMKDMATKKRAAVRLGETNTASKLSELQVIEIRKLLSQKINPLSQKAIAEKYGVSQPLISLINQRKKWSHLD